MHWIQFLRKYGPIPRNENMYDESIQRAARRAHLRPIAFEHPLRDEVLSLFSAGCQPASVILTGTAGDGKTHLCREVWQKLINDSTTGLDEPYVTTTLPSADSKPITVHIIKDLSEWAPQRGAEWESHKEELLQRFCASIFETAPVDVFLIAANDGQLIESWRRLADNDVVIKTRKLFETLLIENKRRTPEASVTLFNLSRGSSALLFDRALDAFLGHPGWLECSPGSPTDEGFFGPNCPIRHNFELLQKPLLRQRLRALVELCDFNDLHLPIRQILLLLSNALLGHPDVKDCLMQPNDVAGIVRTGTVSKASVYSNIFGGNLPENRREAITVFNYLDRFRIGHETTNQVDDILIFGDADDKYRKQYQTLLGTDRFYGADERFRAAQDDYLEGVDEDEKRFKPFLQMLVSKRQALFFTIPEDQEDELGLWEMTVFKYAGEYRTRLIPALRAGRTVEHVIVARLVKGLNRIFAGMLVSGDRELLLATSLSFSQAKISRLIEDRISVRPRSHERVEINLQNGVPVLRVCLTSEIERSMDLHLVRYEFLSRVAEGALPSSFSRECYEDILAFKSQLLAAVAERQKLDVQPSTEGFVTVRLLSLDDSGNALEEVIEVTND
jgi:hypothetical protein